MVGGFVFVEIDFEGSWDARYQCERPGCLSVYCALILLTQWGLQARYFRGS